MDKYVEDIPVKGGKRKQKWKLVVRYDGWVGSRVRIVKRDAEADRAR
jgi:hypothetical protein